MSPLDALGLSLFILILFLGIFLCIHGLPGTILIAADVLFYAIITEFAKIGWSAVLVFALVAVAIEIADVFLAMRSSPHFTPSRLSLIYSLIGAVSVGLLLTPVLLVAGLVGGFLLGGLIGLFIALFIQESQLRPSHRMPFRLIFERATTLFIKGSVAAVLVCFTLLSSYD